MKNSMKRSLKALTLSAFFATMFLVGCEQPMSSVVGADDVAASYGKSSSDAVLGGDEKGQPGKDFGVIFGKLNLTADQMGAIHVLDQQQHDCERTAMDALKASERAIMESFKAQRQAIEAEVKAGTKTKEEARAEMRALEIAQKDAIKNNPERATAEAAVKACHDTFIAGVRAVLTEEQLVTFDAWLANPSNGDKDHRKDDDGKKDDGKKDDDRPKDHSKDGIFKMLNLTADQMGAIDILEKQRHDCETPLLEALRASERAIAESFNAERAAIKAALEAGTITREEAQTQMRDVEMRQKEAMKNNPERAAAEAALKACRDTFNTGVRALLTPEQQAIWDRLMSNKPVDDNGRRKENDHRRKHH